VNGGSNAHAAPAAKEPFAPGTMMVLVAMGLGVLLIANDFTALNVALPAIEEDFDVDVSTAQWVINAYALVFGMAIVTGGRLADMLGRRRIFFLGAVIFAVFSALGGVAPSIEWLIASRVLMGIGAAMMWPAILGMTFAALPASRAALAGALVLGIAGIGNASGPLLGGFLTDALSWRWIFFLNVPTAVFAILVTAARVHQTEERSEERIDYAGIVSLSLGLLLILLALDQVGDWGWGDPRVVGMFAAAVALIAVFAFIEPRMGANALVPNDVIRNVPFAAACMTTLMMSAVFFATVLYVPQFLQKILEWSPLESGLGMLPMLGLFAVCSFASGRLYERLGAKPTVLAGTICLAVGPFLLSLVPSDAGYGSFVPGLAVTGIGVGLFYPSITTAAVTALDQARASLAGGLMYMFQIAGGAIGLGLTTAIFESTSENEVAEKASAAGAQLTEAQENVVHGVLAGTDSGEKAFDQLSTVGAERALDIVRDSFVAGIHAGFLVVSLIAVVGCVIALLFVGGPLRGGKSRKPSGASGSA
jgi:EmrB/QacA subfamily drug resistance transporter